MKNKIRYYWAAGACVLAAFVLMSAAVVDFKLGRNIEILINMMRDISLFYVDDVDPDKLLAGAAEGMTSYLDPYTEYIDAEEMEMFEIMTTGKYGGIGALIRKKGDYILISQPYKGFPADKAGLVAGDKILQIDGQDAKGLDASDVSNRLKGDPGTTLMLKVEKFFTGQVETVTLVRERIAIPGVPYYGFVDDGIGYIVHNDFTDESSTELLQALMELRKMGELQGIILDYRGNGGGILKEAVKVLSFFLPKGTEVVSMKGKTMEEAVAFVTESDPVDAQIPIVVLVSSGSASAAEIVAGAVQDLDRGVLIGRRTFGKGLVQATRPLGYNSYLKVTTAKYYIPSGRCIQAIDYAHRNDDGSVASVPDSLIREFQTLSGRKVYDGGGVMPDIVMDQEYLSPYTIIVYARGLIADFVDQYIIDKYQQIDLNTFQFTDEDYESFISFMSGQEMQYESETKSALEVLQAKAERELYYDAIKQDLDAIEQKLSDDRLNNLYLYREQLQDLIQSEVIIRLFGSEGLTSYKLKDDKDVRQAINVLKNPEEYQDILTNKDTLRK